MERDRLQKQLDFIIEIDKLKHVFRQTILMNESRNENDAEHSWHLAIMAILLAEYSNEKIDVLRVVKMVLAHDLVEIDAGDTYCYDEKGALDKEEREQKAAERIYGILPDDQTAEFRALWEEFEARSTPEAKFAAALDRVQPLMHNYYTQGKSWQEHSISSDKVYERNGYIKDGSTALWDYADELLRSAIEKGYLRK